MGQAGETPALTRNREARTPTLGIRRQPENPCPFGSFVSLSWNADRRPRASGTATSDLGAPPQGGNRVPCPACPDRAVIAVLLAAAFTALSVGPAHAAAYRFWGFYQLTDGQWAFAQKGSDQIVPKDGSVDGWRFAVADVNDVRFPRAT